VPRVLVVAPPSPHTEKWLAWLDALPGWDHDVLTYGDDVADLAGAGRAAAIANLLRGVKHLRNAPPADLVHMHWLAGPGWIGALANRRPLVVSVWGSDILLHAGRSRVGALLTWLAARRADAVTYDAEILAEALVRSGFDRERLHRIVLGPSSQLFRPGARGSLATELGAPPGAKVVLSPRGLAPIYQPDVAVAAFAAAAVDDAVLLVRVGAGDAASREELTAAARRHGVATRVVTYQPVAAERLPELYASADVVLSVPRSDGTSVTLLEALFCDRPVVATDLPANREWLPRELLAPVGDAPALGAVLRQVLTDPAWAASLARDAGRRAREQADEATQIESVGALYTRLVSGERR
jgi:glycosyltransferase involved in cell wall biosynthesis